MGEYINMMYNSHVTIYSDSDGVISDFYGGAKKVLGHDWKNEHISDEERQGKVINGVFDFWENIPPMEGWKIYWSYIEKYSPHILTAFPGWLHDPSVVERGKRVWYKKYLPNIPDSHIHVVKRRDKQKFAVKDGIRNILIDDHVNNIREFESAGGIGILHVSVPLTILRLKQLGY